MLAERRLKRDLESLQGQLNHMLDNLKELKKHGGEAIEAVFDEATINSAKKQIKEVVETVEDSAKKIGADIKEKGKTVQTTIEEHPVMSVLAALGVGFIVGKLAGLGKR